ncbi:MAG: UDP-3-O-(3-hydroxymyristoyl)glucosamine N-acyltransferase [Elusimicrobiota bacterium]|jgi:UDP-3-O-[3-hydroxymyristoyl] glucosamine N-acyltransferase
MARLQARDIAQAVGGELQGDENRFVEGAAGLEEAGEHQISFFHNLKYSDALNRTKAGVVVIPEKTNGLTLPEGKTWIRVSNPQGAFAQILGLLGKDRQRPPQGIHPQSSIDPKAQMGATVGVGAFVVIEAGAVIGSGTVLYPGCYIGANSHVGENCILYPNVTLREDVEVGSRVIIHVGAVLGADGYGFATQNGQHHKIPQIGRVVVEDDVEIGANVTIDRATTGETCVGAGTKIDNLVHIAHNVRIGRHCLIVAQVGISGSTRIGNNVTLAGQVGVAGHLTIGDGAVIAAQSGIMNNVKPGEVLFGSPARPHRQAMKLQAIYGKLPEIYDALKLLKRKFGL